MISPLRGSFQEVLSGKMHKKLGISAKPVGNGEGRLLAYAFGLCALAVAFVGGLVVAGLPFGPVIPIAALAGLAFFAERQGVRVSPTVELSVSFLPFVFAAVAFGPLAAIAVGAFGLLSDFGRPYTRWLVWTSTRTIVCGMAGLAALALGGPSATSFGRLLAAAVAATIVEVVLDVTFSGATVSVRRTGSFRNVFRTQAPLLLSALPLYTPAVAFLAYAYVTMSPWAVLAFLGPAFAAQRLFVLYRKERAAAAELQAANVRLEKVNLSFASALVATLDARDRYTAGHSAAVAIYARDIAARMGLSEEDQRLAHRCGLVHDIGKIGLPPGLLEKTGPLTLDERRQMERHSEIGERILAKVEDHEDVARIVRHHHERWDGHGYPDGLPGDEIPLVARIVAVADAYNAMTSDRPYRDAMPSRVARLRLAQAVESQFDTSVVAAFEAILASANEDYRTGLRADFVLEDDAVEQVVDEAVAELRHLSVAGG